MYRNCRKPDLNQLSGKAWLAARDYQQNLFDELSFDRNRPGNKAALYGDIVYREGPVIQTFWHQTILEKPFITEFKTIREASDILRAIQRNWAHYPTACFRRAELIKEKLPFINEKPKAFPFKVPSVPMGLWTLLDENTLFASAVTSSPFACGDLQFEEDKVNPPSRAYLKLREALTWFSYLHEMMPGPGSTCIDAGACPGGWTWVLDGLGANITAIDRTELDPRLMTRPNISFLKHDAFTLKPSDFGKQDWVFSDVICYPPRLLEWVQEWLASGLCRNFICTIKMQGKPDIETTRAFASIPGSRVLHLSANKNELTWLCRYPADVPNGLIL